VGKYLIVRTRGLGAHQHRGRCANPDRANEMNGNSTMNKNLECMAHGKPVVQTGRKGVSPPGKRRCTRARPDDVIDFAMILRELPEDPERRTMMGAIGRQPRVEGGLACHHQVSPVLEPCKTAMNGTLSRPKSLDSQYT
jgi:hypothetical protein